MHDEERRAVAEQLDRLILWARRKSPPPLSSSAITTLDTLAESGPQRISDLAEHERVTQPGMTTMVNRLEASGHAERVPDPTDGRATLVRITTEGRRLLAERARARAAVLEAELATLPTSDQRALLGALDVIGRLTGSSRTAPIGGGSR